MKIIHRSERTFLLSVFLLVVFGLVVLASTSIPLSQENFGESYYYFRHQLLYGFGLGLILFFLARSLKPKTIQFLAPLLFLLSIIALSLVFVPKLGFEVGGARRWLNILSFSFQPSELFKLALVVYLATWLDKRRYKLASGSSFFSFLFIIGIPSAFIILQPDMGTAILVALVALVMYFVAGAKKKTILALILLAVIVGGALIAIEPYRKARVLNFLNPTDDIQGAGYQLNQALLTIGSGGLAGRGLGRSVQKYQYLPELIGDSIFAIIGEEFGFLGTAGLVFLYIIFLLTGFKIAVKARSKFGTLLVAGIISWIGLQAFINIGGITGLIFFTGIPLPFISYGGTALALELGAVGLVSSVARN